MNQFFKRLIGPGLLLLFLSGLHCSGPDPVSKKYDPLLRQYARHLQKLLNQNEVGHLLWLQDEFTRLHQNSRADYKTLPPGRFKMGLERERSERIMQKARFSALAERLLDQQSRRSIVRGKILPALSFFYIAANLPAPTAQNNEPLLVTLVDTYYLAEDSNQNGKIDQNEEANPFGNVHRPRVELRNFILNLSRQTAAGGGSQKSIGIGKIYRSSQGLFKSVYIPLKTAKGIIFAYACLDFEMKQATSEAGLVYRFHRFFSGD